MGKKSKNKRKQLKPRRSAASAAASLQTVATGNATVSTTLRVNRDGVIANDQWEYWLDIFDTLAAIVVPRIQADEIPLVKRLE